MTKLIMHPNSEEILKRIRIALNPWNNNFEEKLHQWTESGVAQVKTKLK
ncbi:hypothetical protein O4H26_12560 [Aequorivita viscosa]|nr:hypothetical protein [Aequorivita viscosa]